MTTWSPDFLPGYECAEFGLPGVQPAPGEPNEMEFVATLIRKVRRRGRRPRRAMLYLHGWNDYFFQTHLADAVAALGYDFYAIDLRRYGRSLRKGQLRGFVADLDHYSLELDLAAAIIGVDHDELALMGHSTGGLIASLWAARNPEQITGLILNSPWLDLQGLGIVRALGIPVIEAIGSRSPTAVLKLPDLGFYARTLHHTLGGEWDYDLELKSTPSPPIRVGWLRAILLGQQRVAAGLGIEVPILVLSSTATDFSRRWSEDLRTADTVLDVEQIATRAIRLGRHVTIVRIPEALHDVLLSAPEVRAQALAEIGRFVEGYLQPAADQPARLGKLADRTVGGVGLTA